MSSLTWASICEPLCHPFVAFDMRHTPGLTEGGIRAIMVLVSKTLFQKVKPNPHHRLYLWGWTVTGAQVGRIPWSHRGHASERR